MKRRSGRRAIPMLAVLLCGLLVTVACGGDDVDTSLLEGLEFDFSDVDLGEQTDTSAPPTPVISAFAGIGLVDLEQGFRVAYLHDMRSMVDDVEDSTRNLVKLGEGSARDEGMTLDWVVLVHDVHLISEELRFRIYNYPFADDLSVDYVDFHADFLRGVELYTLCADRMLEASLMIDVQGSSADLPAPERAEFRSLVRESEFYCDAAEAFNTRSGEELRRHINALRFDN